LFPDSDRPTATELPDPLIVIDASWPQARKMIRRVPGLGELPVVSLPRPTTAPPRLRRPPNPDGMATIEAIARVLDRLEGPGAGAPLDALFTTFVKASRRARGMPFPPG
jgi:DTW domain-containing protein YfiP